LKRIRVILCLPLLLLVSCSSDSDSSSSGSAPTPARRSLSQRLDESNGYKQDSEGNWIPQSDKRSSFEMNRESAYFKGDYAKKQYKTQDFAKKSWWGDTKYESKQYEGNTDGSRFQTTSKFQQQGAREANTAADIPDAYKTGNYATSTAREAGSKRLGKSSDAETDVRRRVFPQPEIYDWREQRNLSVSETKGILGR
jgi:hypothetical protein